MEKGHKNIFEKYPVPGANLLTKLLNRKIIPMEAVKIFAEHNVTVSERTIQRHMKKMRGNNGTQQQNFKTTPNIVLLPPPPDTDPDTQITKIKREYEAFDFSKIPDVDPIKLLDKHIYELESLLLNWQHDPIVNKNIIELEMKIADKIHKMRPSSTEPDYNSMFRNFDLVTEFIMLRPELKQDWIDFIREKQIE